MISRPWVDTVLSGASTVAQIESNLAAVAVPWDGELDDELASLAEPPEQYWQTRLRALLDVARRRSLGTL